MAEFSKLVITKQGQALIAKIIANEGDISGVKFLEISTSSKQYDFEALEGLTSLEEIQQTNAISKTTRINDTTVKVESAFSNTELSVGYFMRTVGLYANDPDTGKILYGVTIESTGQCYMPPYNGTTVSGAVIELLTTVGNADKIDFTVDPGAAATVADILDLQNKLKNVPAVNVHFTDGDTFQDKLDSGELRGQDGKIGPKGDQGEPGPKSDPIELTLSAESWAEKKQTVNNEMLEMTGYNYVVGSSMTPETNTKTYNEANIRGLDISENGQITFICDDTPATEIKVLVYRIAANGDVGGRVINTSGSGGNHPNMLITSEAGVHGIRYHDNKLQFSKDGDWENINTGVLPQIIVTVSAGSTVKCSDGSTTLSAAATEGTCVFNVPNLGTWTLTATLDDKEATETVTVDTVKQYPVVITYYSATLTVTVQTGAEVKATCGDVVKSATSIGGTATIQLNRTGQYTVQATYNEVQSNTQTVDVQEETTEYSTELSFIVVTVTAENGANVKAQKESVTKEALSAGSPLVFYLPSTGDWTFTATRAEETATEIVHAVAYTNYEVTLSFHKTYGVKITIKGDNTATAVEYTDDAVGMQTGYENWKNTTIFKGIRPCLVKEGVVQYYLDPTNLAKQVGGEAATITSETAGDVMLEIPKLGYKMTTDGTYHYVQVTDDPNADGFCYRAHSMDTEGDCDYIYPGIFLGYVTGNKLYSVSGKSPTVNISLTTARNYATARGDGYQLVSFYPLTLLQCLYLIMFKDRNGQAALGKGYTSASAKTNTGGTVAKGPCYGEQSGKEQMCFMNLEDFWGNLFWWIDGIYSDSSRNVKTDFKNFNDSGNGYQFTKTTGASSNISGYMSDIQGGNDGGYVIKESKGSETTYYADFAVLCAAYCAAFGGHWNDEGNAGPFRLNVDSSASASGGNLGARLLYKHKKAA